MDSGSVRSVGGLPALSFQTLRTGCGLGGNRILIAISLTLILLTSASPVRAAIDEGVEDQSLVIESLPEADQVTFAMSLEKAVSDGDVEGLNALIDWNALLDTVTAGEKNAVLDRTRKEFKRGFIKGLNAEAALAARIVETVKLGGSFKFLRLDRIGNDPIAVFRLKSPNQGGVNYHQYFLKRSEDGLVRATDIYIFLTAERLTETLRRIWLPLAAETSKTLFQRLTQTADPLLTAIQSLPKMQRLVADGQGERALEIYRNLPEKVRQEKALQLIRLQAAQSVSEQEYAVAIEDFRTCHPNDLALDFLLIDGYFLKNDFDKSLECIDRTSKNVGGDSWLLSMRGTVLAHLGRFDEARTAADEAIQLEPDMKDAYFAAIAISLMAKNHNDTAKYLTSFEREFELRFDDLTIIPLYADFVKSPQYNGWLETRK